MRLGEVGPTVISDGDSVVQCQRSPTTLVLVVQANLIAAKVIRLSSNKQTFDQIIVVFSNCRNGCKQPAVACRSMLASALHSTCRRNDVPSCPWATSEGNTDSPNSCTCPAPLSLSCDERQFRSAKISADRRHVTSPPAHAQCQEPLVSR